MGGKNEDKKEMVPSDPFPSLALHRHARHRTMHRVAPKCFAVPLPLGRFLRPRINASRPHRSLSPRRSRSLVATFPSPTTAAASLRPPFQGQWSRSATSRPPGSCPRPVRLRLHSRLWFAPVGGSFFAFSPLRLFKPVRSAASSASTPLRDFYLPRDRSVQQIPPPRGSPSESARFPLAPRCRFYF